MNGAQPLLPKAPGHKEFPWGTVVFDVLHEVFEDIRKYWTDYLPFMGIMVDVNSVVDLVWEYAKNVVTLFFSGHMPAAVDVGNWLTRTLRGSFVQKIHYAAKHFFKVIMIDE